MWKESICGALCPQGAAGVLSAHCVSMHAVSDESVRGLVRLTTSSSLQVRELIYGEECSLRSGCK